MMMSFGFGPTHPLGSSLWASWPWAPPERAARLRSGAACLWLRASSPAASGPRSPRRPGAVSEYRPEPRQGRQARQEPTRSRERRLRSSWLLLLQEHVVVDRWCDHCSLEEAIAVPETTTLKDFQRARAADLHQRGNP